MMSHVLNQVFKEFCFIILLTLIFFQHQISYNSPKKGNHIPSHLKHTHHQFLVQICDGGTKVNC